MLEDKQKTANELYKSGKENMKNNNFEQALIDFNEALRLDPGFTEALLERGNAYAGKGDRTRAILDFQQATMDEQFVKRQQRDAEYKEQLGLND